MEGGSSRQGQSGTRERASQAPMYQGMHAEHAVTHSMPNLLATAFLSHPAASYRLMDALLLCTVYIYIYMTVYTERCKWISKKVLEK